MFVPLLGGMGMEQIAGLRAQWLAQICETIESAQRLAWQLRTRDGISSEARELYGRLEAAKLELQSMRETESWMSAKARPDWLADLGLTVVPFGSDD